MSATLRRRLMLSVAMAGAMTAAACSGGGGGGGVITTPPPTGGSPTPAPPSPSPSPPAPSPSPSPPATGNNDTAEYRASVGPVSMNALVAYDRGATGAGVIVGIIDSGIDLQSAEFGNRVLPASADLAGNGTIDDEGGHGTAVAFTLAGRRNGAGTHGAAFDAQILVLRTDRPGSCASEDPNDDETGCRHSDTAIASALDVARTQGARVVNLSLGGSAPNSTLRAAIARATQAGIILVISAGNDGPNAPNPDDFALVPATNGAIGNGLVIIAGSVGTNDIISDFSNRAGSGANFFLSAVGERVRAPDENGDVFLWSGTSFSAPQISGAIALLAQAFPNLTGAQIVDLLYTTARDGGTPGIDAIYGRGILDLTRAFQPVGQLSLAGSRAPVSTGINASLSAPMGDARTGTLGAVVLDIFDRAYGIDLSQTIDRRAPIRRLRNMLGTRNRQIAVGVKDMAIAVTIAPSHDGGVRIDRLGISGEDGVRARALAASVIGELGSRAQFAIGASESGTSLTARLAGRRDPSFLIARDPASGSGFESDVGGSMAVRRMFGPWGVTVAQETGDVLTRQFTDMPALADRYDRFGYYRSTLAVDRRVGGLRLGFAATRLDEAETVLGARFSGALGGAKARTSFLDMSARWDFGRGWTLGGTMRRGWTQAHLRGGLDGSGSIATQGFAVDIGKRGVLGRSDEIGLRIAQPLRVQHGGLDLMLPAEYDYATESVSGWDRQRLNLAPQGSELDVEISYMVPFFGGDVQSNLFWRRDPGHFAAVPDDWGAAVSLRYGF